MTKMRPILFLFTVILFSCGQAEKEAEDDHVVAATPQKTVQPEDSATARIHDTLSVIVKAELQFSSPIRSMAIDSVRYQVISLKAYYHIQREELAGEAHLSTNKEKTNRALAYLDVLKAKASIEPVVYKVQFHLNATLANGIVYNEGHIKYLRKNLSEIRIVFP